MTKKKEVLQSNADSTEGLKLLIGFLEDLRDGKIEAKRKDKPETLSDFAATLRRIADSLEKMDKTVKEQ